MVDPFRFFCDWIYGISTFNNNWSRIFYYARCNSSFFSALNFAEKLEKLSASNLSPEEQHDILDKYVFILVMEALATLFFAKWAAAAVSEVDKLAASAWEFVVMMLGFGLIDAVGE